MQLTRDTATKRKDTHEPNAGSAGPRLGGGVFCKINQVLLLFVRKNLVFLDKNMGGPTLWDGYVVMVVADAFVQSTKTGQPQAVPDLEQPALYAR